ncbi:DnaJ domain-containing protein [Leadbettera azotonutricia]|uniref:DnaJ-like protein n=1 Tax=Leadbettera azotonutricia (strain ATCC BAA-888 / DSM 13862 / ZAS-9) TaxID=545695 RepID=F5YEH1_LEAAZ|nr:DnaJ domain-containing protein [Leadbettera azotonutricia]AEF82767.1 DnaJ-like protein [Leadbettera azotonutricia ZAS-9]
MNNYDILGVQYNASINEIRKAYKRLVLQYHPDLNKSTDAYSKFLEIHEAYESIVNNAVFNGSETFDDESFYEYSTPFENIDEWCDIDLSDITVEEAKTKTLRLLRLLRKYFPINTESDYHKTRQWIIDGWEYIFDIYMRVEGNGWYYARKIGKPYHDKLYKYFYKNSQTFQLDYVLKIIGRLEYNLINWDTKKKVKPNSHRLELYQYSEKHQKKWLFELPIYFKL